MRHSLDHLTVVDPTPNFDLPFEERSFASGLDVACAAAAGDVLVGQRRCESWHLDCNGRFVCGTRGTVSDSLSEWAANPSRLIGTFQESRAVGSCTPTWVIVDERPTMTARVPQPGELDVEQFVRLRRCLKAVGITLVDAVIFDDDRHWWSIDQLLTGQFGWEVYSHAVLGGTSAPAAQRER